MNKPTRLAWAAYKDDPSTLSTVTTRFRFPGLAECFMACVDFEREERDSHSRLLILVGWLAGAADLTAEQSAKLDRWLDIVQPHSGCVGGGGGGGDAAAFPDEITIAGASYRRVGATNKYERSEGK
jgi:hypothetical protein